MTNEVETKRHGQPLFGWKAPWPNQREILPSHTVSRYNDPLDNEKMSLNDLGRVTGMRIA